MSHGIGSRTAAVSGGDFQYVAARTKPELKSGDDDMHLVSGVELREDVADVDFNCARCQDELLGDALTIGQSLGDEADYVLLSGGQFRERSVVSLVDRLVFVRGCEAFEQSARRAGSHDGVPAWTCLMAETSSSVLASLRRKPLAPAWSAS